MYLAHTHTLTNMRICAPKTGELETPVFELPQIKKCNAGLSTNKHDIKYIEVHMRQYNQLVYCVGWKRISEPITEAEVSFTSALFGWSLKRLPPLVPFVWVSVNAA